MQELTQISGLTAALSKAGLAEGTNAATIKTAAPNGAGVDYVIAGIAYHKADTDNIAMDALDVQADDTTCLYGVDINAAGTVSMVKGTEVSSAALANGEVALQPPPQQAGKARLGLIKVATDGATFTCGTTDLGAGTVTDTYYDTVGNLAGPITS